MLLCRALERLGVADVFGVPGTQTIGLWEGLRRHGRPRPIVATNELAASFMANGYARATGRVGVLLTIPGPGFTYALTGIAEALLDSAPIVHIVGAPAVRADGGFALQAIAQMEIAAPLTKGVLCVERVEEIEATLAKAFALAASGEPGPVVVQVRDAALQARTDAAEPGELPEAGHAGGGPGDGVAAAAELLRAARRPLVFTGQGAAGGAESVRELVELLPAPIVTTTSGRGVVSERHPLSLRFDSPGAPTSVMNELVDACDLVVALGVKLSHNGSLGTALRLPPDKLVRVDASASVLERAYPAAVAVEADSGRFLAELTGLISGSRASTWTDAEVAEWRDRLAAAAVLPREPLMAGLEPADVFATLRRHLPDTAVVTTDSGLHQYLVRRHLPVLAPRTLLVPADFQSMGFGLPAAIGASAGTGRAAVAVIGDGGFAISGLELATAVHHGIPVTVVVLVDRSFGLIRRQQLRRTGHESGVELPALDVGLVAAAAGARHHRLEAGTCEEVFAQAFDSELVAVIEIETDDSRSSAHDRRLGIAATTARSLLGSSSAERIADALKRRRS